MEFLHAVFNILVNCELFLTYPMRAIIGELEVYKVLTSAKAYVLIPSHPCPVRLRLIHIKNKSKCINHLKPQWRPVGSISAALTKCKLVIQSALWQRGKIVSMLIKICKVLFKTSVKLKNIHMLVFSCNSFSSMV